MTTEETMLLNQRLVASATLGLLLCSVQAAASGAVATPSAQPSAEERPDPQTRVLDLAGLDDMDVLLDRLADRRVIFVGETHDRYEDHLNQLAVIEGLHARGRPLAIGLEFFQQPYQDALDAYVAGEIDEHAFLRQTQYYDRWRFDYRLYRPILQFARENRIPLIALNLESELTRRVGEVGIDGLTPEERARIPSEIDRSDPSYRERIEAVFAMHPSERQQDVEHFIEVQLLWDEGMAERAAAYLEAHPERTLVVLAGSGHLEYGQGIPKRLARRLDVPAAIVLNGTQRPVDPVAADFFLYPQTVELPKSGLMGVMLGSPVDEQGAIVQGFAERSGAKAAGIKEGDRIVQVGGASVQAYSDIRIALMDSRPGDRLAVEVLRPRTIGADERLRFEVVLH
jgi:uncharacterized iron-regulated protein